MTDTTRDVRGLGATIVGAAREGTALARYFARRGARVTPSDAKPREALAAAAAGPASRGGWLARDETPRVVSPL